jgi:tripartite-type tricarboxylate transporter receptor subunit TctC
MTNVSRRSVLAAAAGIMASSAGSWAAERYPDRPVKIIVPFAPGGPTDIMARVVAAHLGERLHGSFVVDNRPGAGGNIGAALVAHNETDGYQLLLTSSALVVNPGLYKHIPYDPYKDFAPIAELGTSPNVFLATPGSGIKSIADLVAKAKADPRALSYASAGIGTTPHLSGELLKVDAGIQMTHVPFGGAGPAIQAIMGATTPIACVSLPPARPLIGTGALVALAVTGTTRWFDLPDVPTMVELGYKDFVTDTFQGFLAPAKTPDDIVAVLAKTSVDILHDKTVHDQLQANGFEVLANGPTGMQRRIDQEVPKWRDLIAKAGIAAV